jgi:hypothetical protein
LWELAKQLQLGDVVVADCWYAGYFLIAWLMRLGVDVVIRQHQRRATDFRRGQRLGARDHVVSWNRPKCPKWMDEVTYATMPQTVTLREARVGGWTLVTTLIDPHEVHKQELFALYRQRWQVAVSSEGHILQSVEVRPRLKDSGLVAWEAPWRESKTAEPSDNVLEREYWQSIRLQRAVNAGVASSHAIPVAETVYNVRRQQGLGEMSPTRQPSPAGSQRRHGTKEDGSTGEARGARRGKLVEEMSPITVSGKWRRRRPGGGSGRSTVDRRATKRARREGPGPVSTPLVKVRQG